MSEPEFYLPWRKQWDLFTSQKHIYQDGVWVEIDNITSLEKRPKAILQFFTDWQKMDWYCWHDGVIGWFCAVEHDNLNMQQCLLGVGATEWRKDKQYTYFYKHTLGAPEPLTFHEFNQRVKAYRKKPVEQAEEPHVKPTV